MGAAAAGQMPPAGAREPRWPRRYTVIGLFFLSTVICYLDRVNVSVAIIPMAQALRYDPSTQGLVLSAFFWGYLFSQLVGGWLADRYGGKRVLAAGVACWSVATLMTPPASRHLWLLLAMRVLLGLGEGVNFPAIHSLAARWAPTTERGRALTLNYSGIYLGTILALLVSPPLIVWLGWQGLFYASGGLGLVWLFPWMIKADDGPEDGAAHSWKSRAAPVPWRAIFRTKAVWAIVIAHTCTTWGFYILLLWLPSYLHLALKVPLAQVGKLSMIPWLLALTISLGVGWLSDALQARGVSATLSRKTMQVVGFAIGAAPMLLIPRATTPGAAIALVTVSVISCAFSLGGWGINHLDVGPQYAGILMGISNTVATVPGIVGVAVTGLIVQATGSFAPVFYLTAAIYIVGIIGYLAWASGERKL